MLWKLLKQHISIPQMTGFFLANLCGMTIVLLSIQFYKDVLPVFTQEDTFMKKDYVILTKRVSTIGSIAGRSSAFSADEMNEIKSQPFVRQSGGFMPAQFKVMAGISMGGINMRTDMFFESMPDEFVDVKSDRWQFSESDDEVPIIVPRNYLNLYNFGFAQSRNLPQLSEGVIGMVNLNVELYGNGKSKMMKGKIAGFSNRLNTILVPESFIAWGNREFGSGKEANPNRVIMEVTNPTDDRIVKFIRTHGYDTEGDELNAGKATWFLKVVTSVVMSVGLFISILSFYILLLSIYLLIQKNTVKLENLLMIGFSPSQVALPYQLLTIILSGAVWIIGMGIVYATRGLYADTLSELCPSTCSGGMLPSILAGCTLFIIVSALNYIIIKKKIASLFFAKRK